jgi:hypothetical protein
MLSTGHALIDAIANRSELAQIHQEVRFEVYPYV